MSSLPPQATRRFHFLRCLGSGTFGEVYEAEMESASGLSRRVAVKLLRSEVADDADAVRRLYDEGMLLARLDHPSILSVIDLVRFDDRRALVTEFVDGEDLTSLMRRDDVDLPRRVMLEIAAQTARALDAAWGAQLPGCDRPLNLIHRDVKPGNIRVSRHGVVKLLDFGVARSDVVDREARTEVAIVVGSVPFMAPEMFLQDDPGHMVDTFGLGAVLYEGLTGRRFYLGVNKARVLQLLAMEEAFTEHLEAQLRYLKGNDELKRIVRASLTYDPQHRLTARELALELERMAASEPGPSLAVWCRSHDFAEPGDEEGRLTGKVLTEGTHTTVRRPMGRNTSRAWVPLLGGLAALGVVGCLGVGAVAWTSSPTDTPVKVTAAARPSPTRVAVRPPRPAPTAPAVPSQPENPAPEPSAVAPSDVDPAVAPSVDVASLTGPPAPSPAPSPVPSAPAPAAPAPAPVPKPAVSAPAPAPKPAPTSLQVYFQDAAGARFGADQSLPPGPYTIVADFGDGLKDVGAADVEPGQQIRLRCSRSQQTCSVD